jgi:hypothetical protein
MEDVMQPGPEPQAASGDVGSGLFYIQTDDPGEMALWWRPGRSGYTRNLHEAGVYVREEAMRIETLRPPQDKAWAVEEILRRERSMRFVLAAALAAKGEEG